MFAASSAAIGIMFAQRAEEEEEEAELRRQAKEHKIQARLAEDKNPLHIQFKEVVKNNRVSDLRTILKSSQFDDFWLLNKFENHNLETVRLLSRLKTFLDKQYPEYFTKMKNPTSKYYRAQRQLYLNLIDAKDEITSTMLIKKFDHLKHYIEKMCDKTNSKKFQYTIEPKHLEEFYKVMRQGYLSYANKEHPDVIYTHLKMYANAFVKEYKPTITSFLIGFFSEKHKHKKAEPQYEVNKSISMKA